ncbi:glycosyltransferase [Streptococcus cuniculi]|uniref:Glycosyltransferase n=1 Tax=Streptococcus cuniculi TaxID=1432788 RepID=A0A4Y9JBY2_9STRE|nr:glycosyltransferase [Streptococcus cuniculi]MBF0777818.1 glycosyltransferase [Streptococcus cuniculi]TFU98452.1 glycosyltransferase [Streptococcus cuniculi]
MIGEVDKKFSVLLSLYVKENPLYLQECLESLVSQTRPASEWVIVEDGPLSQELYQVLDSYQERYPDLIKRVPLEQNVGLGLALREGMLHCSYELVARMDTDDIARTDRFERQLVCFEQDPTLDICGSHILEFDIDPQHPTAVRKVPLLHDDIVNYQKSRSAFNHMTVMFKKSSVVKAGNYEDAPLMEDDMLWVRMFLSGAKGMNIDDYLVDVRTGAGMIERRGGLSYLKKYRAGRKKILETGFISRFDYYKTVGIQSIVALVPHKIRFLIFTQLLRNKKELSE